MDRALARMLPWVQTLWGDGATFDDLPPLAPAPPLEVAQAQAQAQPAQPGGPQGQIPQGEGQVSQGQRLPSEGIVSQGGLAGPRKQCCWAIVTFNTRAEAERALEGLDGSFLPFAGGNMGRHHH